MQAPAASARILDDLDDSRLLSRPRYEELVTDILSCCDDWPIIASELVYGGWLTPFQARWWLQERGRELLVGSYVLEDLLGEGGMGVIYRAHNR